MALLYPAGTSNTNYFRAPLDLISGPARPFSLFAWVRSVNTTAADLACINLGQFTPSVRYAYIYLIASRGFGVEEYDGANAAQASSGTGALPASGAWVSFGVSLTSASSRTLYWGQGSSATNTTSVNDIPLTDIILCGNGQINSAIAECAVWQASLGSAEFLALQNGANPLTIRPGALTAYYPLRNSLADLGPRRIGLAGVGIAATTAPAWTDHPPVALPPTRRLFFPSAAPTSKPRMFVVA